MESQVKKDKNIKNVPSRQSVITLLLEQILSGQLKAGSSIPTETEMTKQAGVSRTVIREAVHLLIAKSILSAEGKKGTRVQHFQNWNHLDADVISWVRSSRLASRFLEHVLEIRLIIEPEAAALAAMRASTADIFKIEEALEQMETAQHMQSEKSIMGDILFHESILLASDNIILARFKDLFSAAIEMSIELTFSQSEDIALTLLRHRELFEAIYLREHEKARKKAFSILEQSAKDFKSLKIPVRSDALLVLGR